MGKIWRGRLTPLRAQPGISLREPPSTAERLEAFAEQGDFARAQEAMSALEREMERLGRALIALRGVTVP